MIHKDPFIDLCDFFVRSTCGEFDRFCKSVDKIYKEINDMCDEGDRQVRLETGNFTPDDIIGKEGN